jgi:hypothetical protein
MHKYEIIKKSVAVCPLVTAELRGISVYFFLKNIFRISIQIINQNVTRKIKMLIDIKHITSELKFKTIKKIMTSSTFYSQLHL